MTGLAFDLAVAVEPWTIGPWTVQTDPDALIGRVVEPYLREPARKRGTCREYPISLPDGRTVGFELPSVGFVGFQADAGRLLVRVPLLLAAAAAALARLPFAERTSREANEIRVWLLPPPGATIPIRVSRVSIVLSVPAAA